MSTTFDDHVAGRLAAAVRAELNAPTAGGVVRVVEQSADIDAIEWLRRAPAGSRSYWRSREEDIVVAGAGVAMSVDGRTPADLAAALHTLPAAGALFVTGRFDGDVEPATEWAPFGHVRATLPRLELRVEAAGCTLACMVTDADRRDPASLEDSLARLVAIPGSGDGLPARVSLQSPAAPAARQDLPDRARWGHSIKDSLEAVDAGRLQKVVLARRSSWDLHSPLDPADALGRMATHAPACFHVMVESGESAFLSATPERLFSLAGGRVTTEAVAGTIAGDAPVMAFLDKDLREHAYVVDDVRNRLSALADEVRWDDSPGILALARRRHLRTRIAAAARAGAGPLEVLAALHPTPAVGGTPRGAALDYIREKEGFDRGLYAGYVGRISRGADGGLEADVAVGIRSALLQPRRASLYAGAGIVAGSEAQAEWDEVEGKMSDLARAIGLS